MATEWSNKKVITFLEILQTEPCLWDPKHKNFTNHETQNDAWRRIMEKLPFQTSVEEMKKKKESLIGYYRTHLNKIKKSLKSGAGNDDVYTTSWFAFETMNIFLRGVYDSSHTLNTETHNENEAQERNKVRNDGNQNSAPLSTETEEASLNIQSEYGTRPKENISSHNYFKKSQLKDELLQEIKAARRQMDESFRFMKENKDDECEMFGRLLASNLKKIGNPNTRDILMNDIQNLLFRACMADRLEQQSAVPQFSTSQSPHHQTYSSSPNPPSYQTPLGLSTFLSPHHQAYSPQPNPPSYQSPLGLSTSPYPHHQAYSSQSNPPSYQSPLGLSTFPSPNHQTYSPQPNPPSYQSPLGLSTFPSPNHQAYSPPPNPPSYQSPLGLSTSPSLHHQEHSRPLPNPPSYQSPLKLSTSLSPNHQACIPPPNFPSYQSPLGLSTSTSSHHQAYSRPPPNPPSYESPLGLSTALSPQHQAYSRPPPSPPSYQSPLGLSISPSPHHQANSRPPPNHPSDQPPLNQDTNPPSDQFSVETSQENFLEFSPPTRGSQKVITDSGELKIIKD